MQADDDAKAAALMWASEAAFGNTEVAAPKILGDIVESLVGAVYIDSHCNFDRTWEVRPTTMSVCLPACLPACLPDALSVCPMYCPLTACLSDAMSLCPSLTLLCCLSACHQSRPGVPQMTVMCHIVMFTFSSL